MTLSFLYETICILIFLFLKFVGEKMITIQVSNEEINSDFIVIDLNMAYNSLCDYSDNYNCTVVPEVNFLDVKIKAGVASFNRSH